MNRNSREMGIGRLTASIFLKVVVPIVLIVAAVAFARYQIETAPKAKTRPAAPDARLVEVMELTRTTTSAVVEAMGTVSASREVTLVPQVSGEIVWISAELVPGGIVKQEQELARIDHADYENALMQRQSELARAELARQQELGNQALARQEYEMLGDVLDPAQEALVLRQPHLASAQATVAAAAAAVEKAKLDIKRCTIRAPFNAIVSEKHLDAGAIVGPGGKIATLTGIDKYWLELAIPVNRLEWIIFPEGDRPGSPVKIFDQTAWEAESFRTGRVLRLLGSVEAQGRMAKVLVEIDDPLALENGGEGRVLKGAYVRAEIEGRQIEDVFAVDRRNIRDGSNVWIMNSEGRLDVRPVNIRFAVRDTVYIANGISPGEKLVVTDIAAPVAGMALRTKQTRIPGSEVKK